MARYERIKDFDFSSGKSYVEKTEPFWAEVRAAWKKISLQGGFKLKKSVDEGELFMPFFNYAQKLEDGRPFVLADARSFVEKTLSLTYLAP